MSPVSHPLTVSLGCFGDSNAKVTCTQAVNGSTMSYLKNSGKVSPKYS